ncbi:MAG: YhfC family intramembrane metalloprotease [Clostridia bacterium]|nr:YhfC family intramembrane metalloprotease [Clostridia bacterium]
MSPAVPFTTLLSLGVTALLAAALPMILLFVFKRKGADVLPFFIGCAVFFLFALVIEGLINFAVSRSPAWDIISGNMILYGVFGGLMAGIFEETGRFIAFKTVLKKKLGNDMNALMYGAGHGGCEAVMLVSVSYLTYAVLILLNCFGALSKIAPADAVDQLMPILDSLTQSSPWLILAAVLERASAIAAHIAFSVFVWFGVKDKKRLILFPAAILLHALFDFVAVLAANYFMLPVLATEGIVFAMSALLCLGAYFVYKKCRR